MKITRNQIFMYFQEKLPNLVELHVSLSFVISVISPGLYVSMQITKSTMTSELLVIIG